MQFMKQPADGPVCEHCGESHIDIRSENAGACATCYATNIRDLIAEHTGDQICGAPIYNATGYPVSVCIVPKNMPHTHALSRTAIPGERNRLNTRQREYTPLDKVYTEGPINPRHFDSYDTSQYIGTLEEARSELAYFVDTQWATPVPNSTFDHPITSSEMQALIREHLLYSPYADSQRLLVKTSPDNITTAQNDNQPVRYFTEGHLLDAYTHDPIPGSLPLEFPTNENESTWNQLADEELHRNGLTRVSPWRRENSTLYARVMQHRITDT